MTWYEMEKELQDLYWMLCNAETLERAKQLAGIIEALQFKCAQMRGYDGD